MRLTPDKKLHSREHLLAEDLSRALSEPRRFAAYLGIAKRYDESELRALARYAVEKKDLPVEARGKYFFASLKGLIKKPTLKKAVRKPKKKKKSNRHSRKPTMYGEQSRTKNNRDHQGARPTGRSFGRAGKGSPKKGR